MTDKDKVLAGRAAVQAYYEAHAKLYLGPWHPGIPEEHNPLTEKMMSELSSQGFNTFDEFSIADKALRILES